MDKNYFCFDLEDTLTPEVVIRNSLKQIEEATNEYVVGNIKEYSGPISAYTRKSGLAATISSFATTAETVEVDIQDDLGAQDKENHRYEVFLTAKGLDHYKYRMMFVDYGTVSYPVTIVLNETLAAEYSGRRQTTFSIRKMKDLEEMLHKVINSAPMIALIQSLIYEVLRQQSKSLEIPQSAGESDETK